MYTQMKARPRPLFTSLPTGLLQRACACGGTPGVDGECEECRKKRLSRQPSAAHVTSSQAVPTIVHDVLHSSGHPLDARTRTFMETRFGHDFSNVRVHTDARAAESARAVNALAYTVGRDVVFGTGQYAPDSSEGRKLMAHELTHVVQQQNSNTNRVQTSLIIGDANDHREQEAEQVAKAVVYGTSVNALPEVAGLNPVLRRVVGPCPDTSTPHTLLKLKSQNPAVREAQRKLNQFHNNEKAAKKAGLKDAPLVEDCIFGEKTYNAVLSFQKLVFPKQPAEHDGIIGDHTWKELDKVGPTQPGPTQPGPSDVCGPDVSSEVTRVWSQIQSEFGPWSFGEKEASCRHLVQPVILDPSHSLVLNQDAFDTIGLFQGSAGWTRRTPYHPPCGEPGTSAPPGADEFDPGHEDPTRCSNSVQIGSDCWLSGTPNYGTFGIMMRLCYDWTAPLTSLGFSALHDLFSATSTLALVATYKKLKGDDPSLPVSWALTTYFGGPGARVSGGNRAHCRPTCSVAFSGPAFDYVWEPTKPR